MATMTTWSRHTRRMYALGVNFYAAAREKRFCRSLFVRFFFFHNIFFHLFFVRSVLSPFVSSLSSRLFQSYLNYTQTHIGIRCTRSFCLARFKQRNLLNNPKYKVESALHTVRLGSGLRAPASVCVSRRVLTGSHSLLPSASLSLFLPPHVCCRCVVSANWLKCSTTSSDLLVVVAVCCTAIDTNTIFDRSPNARQPVLRCMRDWSRASNNVPTTSDWWRSLLYVDRPKRRRKKGDQRPRKRIRLRWQK